MRLYQPHICTMADSHSCDTNTVRFRVQLPPLPLARPPLQLHHQARLPQQLLQLELLPLQPPQLAPPAQVQNHTNNTTKMAMTRNVWLCFLSLLQSWLCLPTPQRESAQISWCLFSFRTLHLAHNHYVGHPVSLVCLKAVHDV